MNISVVFSSEFFENKSTVEQAKDRFGEWTVDINLLRWCYENEYLFITNNARDFERLRQKENHIGLFLYYDHSLPDTDPEGLARTVDEVIDQYGVEGLTNELIDLGEWYNWLYK